MLRPMSIEPFDLDINGHLCPCRTAKATHLAKLAPQLSVGALQQRGGADELACYPIQCIVGDRLLKIALQGRHGFGGSRSPLLGKGRQTLLRFLGTLGLINGTGLLHQLLPRFLVRVAYRLLRVEKKGERMRKKKAEELPRGRVVDINHISNKEQSVR